MKYFQACLGYIAIEGAVLKLSDVHAVRHVGCMRENNFSYGKIQECGSKRLNLGPRNSVTNRSVSIYVKE